MLVEVFNSDDPCYLDQFEDPNGFNEGCKPQATNAPPILHEQTSTISDFPIQDKETKCCKKVKRSNHRSQ